MDEAWLPGRQGATFMTVARALCVALALCLGSTAAFAHAYLEKAAPTQRATLFAPPERVQLWFNERLEAAFCSMSVTDASNNKVDQGDVRVAPDNPKLLSVVLNR